MSTRWTGLVRRWWGAALRIVLGVIFVYAGWTKFMGPAAFAESIATFRMLPDGAVNLVALGLPLAEMFAGAMLIAGVGVRIGAFAVLAMTLGFTAALGQALARGLEVDCGCFGGGEPSDLKTWLALGRDLAILAGASVVYQSRLAASGIGGEEDAV